MSKKKQEKRQPAGRLAIALLILTALVFMLLGPKAKAESNSTPSPYSTSSHINLHPTL